MRAPAPLNALVMLALSACAAAGSGMRRDGGLDVTATDVPGLDAPGLDAPTSDTPAALDAPVPECGSGASRACTTTCGSAGIQQCVAERWGACQPPLEDCNGRDDDCDMASDEMIAPRMCSGSCGGGTESCAGGRWSGCTATMPMPETCNGMDDDCDSRIDETLMRACSTACGTGTEECRMGTFVGCTAPLPRTETCNAMNDDCDGATDEAITRPCSSACGMGTERCMAGAFVGCTAPPVPMETCNRLDDDCDGTVDDGLQVTSFAAVSTGDLAASQPACFGPSATLDVCLTATHRWCAGRGCYDSGFGYVEDGGGTGRVFCLGPRAATVIATTFAEITSASGIGIDGSNVFLRVAQAATNRFCRARGYEAGFGPVEHADPIFYATCVNATFASYRPIATSELRVRGCDPVVAPDAIGCASAADRYCRDNGFEAGWGPVEWNDTDAAVVCARD